MVKIVDIGWEEGVKAEGRKMLVLFFCLPSAFIFQSILGVDPGVYPLLLFIDS